MPDDSYEQKLCKIELGYYNEKDKWCDAGYISVDLGKMVGQDCVQLNYEPF